MSNNYKMKYFILCVFVFFSHASEAFSEESRGSSINIIVGLKELESSPWYPVDEQNEIGLEYVLRKEGFPLAIVFELLIANSIEVFGLKEKSSSTEINTGVRYESKMWEKTIPYLEAGISYVKGERESEWIYVVSPDDNFKESALGVWAGVGNTWLLKNNIELGFKLKITAAKADFPSGARVDLGGTHIMFYGGINFGKI